MGSTDQILFAYRRARRIMWEKWITSANGFTRACTGCPSTFCCYQLPLSHPMEGIVAASYLLREDRMEEIEIAREQGQRQHDLWWDSFEKTLKARTREEAMEESGTGAEAWYDLKEPCIFLRDGDSAGEGCCSVYPVRPTMCATYFVQDRCTHFVGANEPVPVGNNMEVVAAVMDLSDEAFSALTSQQVHTMPVPFGLAVASGADMLVGHGASLVGMEMG